MLSGRVDIATRLGREAFEAAEATDRPDLIGCAASNLGTVFVIAGRGEEAAETLEHLLQNQDEPYLGHCLSQTLALHYGSLPSADRQKHLRFATDALRFADRGVRPAARVSARQSLASALASGGRFVEASELAAEAIRLLGDEISAEHSVVIGTLGFCHCQSGDMSVGVRQVCQSIAIARSEGALIYELAPRVWLANFMLTLGRPRDAEFHLRVAQQIDRLAPGPSEDATILPLLGEALKRQRRSREALATFQDFEDRYATTGGEAELLMGKDARDLVSLI